AFFLISDEPRFVKRLADEFAESFREFRDNPRAFITAVFRSDRDNRRKNLLRFGLAIGIIFYALAFAAMLIFWTANPLVQRAMTPHETIYWVPRFSDAPQTELPKSKDKSGGGGGGGNQEKTPATEGELPLFSLQKPINAPTTKPQLVPPLFPIQPNVMVDPNLQPKRDDLAPMGVSDGAIGPPSDGPGRDGGIGDGRGGTVGDGDGLGLNKGNKWGINGGDPGDPRARKSQQKVDSLPVPLNRPRPNYTEEARKNKTQGTARLSVLVGSDGIVKQVRVIRGLSDGLGEEAIRAAMQMRFRPAIRNSQPVDCWVTVDIEFNLR
ncbi:MAG TPA: TonB family protein, partial [Blastocatellia bacterium]